MEVEKLVDYLIHTFVDLPPLETSCWWNMEHGTWRRKGKGKGKGKESRQATVTVVVQPRHRTARAVNIGLLLNSCCCCKGACPDSFPFPPLPPPLLHHEL